MTAVIDSSPEALLYHIGPFDDPSSGCKMAIKQGLVKKKQVEKTRRRPSVLPKATWKDRVLRLDEDVLRWKDGRWIWLDQIEAIEQGGNDLRTFKIATHEEILVIQAPTFRERDEWCVAVSKQVHLRSEQHLDGLRRSRNPCTDDELCAYRRVVKTNAIMQRLTTRTLR